LLSAHDSGVQPTGTLLMGTVRGDLHDIGKNLVCMMAEGAGFKVVDIGVDQSIEKFLAASELHKPDVIGMSALLTTTMTYMKTVVDGYRERGLSQKFAVGGAPISQSFADEIKADGYGADASSAVDLFMYLVGKGEAPKAKSKIEAINEVKHEREQSRRDPNAKSKYQILYWQDIPSEIKAWDDFDEVKLSLPEKFALRIDASAQKQGLISQDAYAAHYRWGEELECNGSPREAAEALIKELSATN
jgi:cobalamin-dependent methionine synthase I